MFGHRVVDPYRWMEGPQPTELVPWLEEQDAFTRERLAAVPARNEIAESVRRQLRSLGTASAFVIRKDLVYFFGRPPGARQARLLRKPLRGGDEVVLLDPDHLSNERGPASISQWSVSPSGRYLAYVLGFGGNEDCTLRILDTKTGKDLPESVDKVYYASIQWLPDETGFVYQRHLAMGAPGAKGMFTNNVVLLHRLGKAMTEDVPVFGKDVGGAAGLRDTDFVSMELDTSGQYALGIADVGTSAPSRVFAKPLADLTRPGSKFVPVFTEADGIRSFSLVGSKVYGLAEGRRIERELVVVDLAATKATPPRSLLAMDGATLQSLHVAKDGLFLAGRRGMDLFVTQTDFQGHVLRELAAPAGQAVHVAGASPRTRGVFLAVDSFVEPRKVVRYEGGRRTPFEVASLGSAPALSGEPTAVRIEWATSFDGTKVPMTVLEPGDGTGKRLPTMMTAYSAYGSTTPPAYSPRTRAWLERGGRYVICHARGSGDLGEAWHRAAQREKKRVSVDDTVACAEHLHHRNEADATSLAFHGRSAGGIIASTLVADRPDLFAAVAVEYPVTEASRFEHSAGGPANVPEFGSSSTKEGYEALLRVDGYNGLRPGVMYPHVLVTTGISDNRVPAWMPSKFAARLQSFAKDPARVKLRVDFDDGHGITSTSEQIASYIGDMLGFAWNAMAEAGGTSRRP